MSEQKIIKYSFQDTLSEVPVENKNTIDSFKNLSTAEINSILDKDRLPMVNVFMNLSNDFNKASGVRCANAFGGQEVIFVGHHRFDRRGTVGTHHYTPMSHTEEFTAVREYLKENGYTIYAVDNTPEFHPEVVYDVDLPEKTAFVYGEEKLGLSEEIVSMCDNSIYIPQYGSVRSLNVAQAAAVMMSEYSRRHRFESA